MWQRPTSYIERRSDGYVEPELIFLVGTTHISRKSAMDVARVIQVDTATGRKKVLKYILVSHTFKCYSGNHCRHFKPIVVSLLLELH